MRDAKDAGMPERIERYTFAAERAKQLRKNMTDAEHVLWRELRRKQLGVKFRRQCPIRGYIVDFFAPSIQLGVEVNGAYHYEEEQIVHDTERMLELTYLGIHLVEFTNNQVINHLSDVVASLDCLIPELVERYHSEEGKRDYWNTPSIARGIHRERYERERRELLSMPRRNEELTTRKER
jgi:very-short-patch-repair endonuclease